MPFSKQDHNLQAYLFLHQAFIELKNIEHSSRYAVKEVLDGIWNSMTKEEQKTLAAKRIEVLDDVGISGLNKVQERFENAVESLLKVLHANMKDDSTKILIAEDQKADRFLFEKAWKKAGMGAELVFVNDGAELIRYIETNEKPDLILLDLRMPVKDGFETLKELKKRKYNVPVIVLSTSNSQLDRVRAMNLGADYYLAKPPSLEGFVGVVKDVEKFWHETNPEQEEE